MGIYGFSPGIGEMLSFQEKYIPGIFVHVQGQQDEVSGKASEYVPGQGDDGVDHVSGNQVASYIAVAFHVQEPGR